jgi:spoIIIJ-associated protein
MEESIQFAKKYLEDVLSFFGLNVDVYATTEDNEVIELHVPSTHMNGFLIGNHGDTMRSLQYLTSMALKSAEHEITRVNVDIADYKKQRASRLEEKAAVWLEDVKKSGEDKSLPPMNSADRRTIHKLAGEHGLETVSEGEGRDRHIILKAGVSGEDEDKSENESEGDD